MDPTAVSIGIRWLSGYAKVFLEVAAGEQQSLQMEINKKEHI